jgi:hypothetical protein
VSENPTAVGRSLGVVQRFVLREQLRRLEDFLDPLETVQVMAPGWWRGHRSLVAVTTARVVLVRRALTRSTFHPASFLLRAIEHLNVHPAPPEGLRFRLTVGLDLEEFTVTGHWTEFERALRAPRR